MNLRTPLVLVTALATACGQPGSDSGPSRAPAQESRALIMAIRYEPTDLAIKISAQAGADVVKRPFNASLALVDSSGNPRPYLAEALPELNTASWKVFPDGRMETTHRLRPGLTWHDGSPLTAEDFVFAWRVYVTPELGVFSLRPQDKMEEVLAPDPRTVVIRWNSPYPDASALVEARDGSLEPLPRHRLESAFGNLIQNPAARDSFLNLPFWTSEYVGAGPYRLETWEPGSHLEGVAFQGHALGPPKIARIVMRLLADENLALTNVLAGSVDIATRFTLRFEHALVLKREWEAAGRGVILMGAASGGPHPLVIQFRPEFQKTPELLDPRVRKALAHAVEKQALLDGLFEGEGQSPDTFVARDEPYYPDLDRIITKYSYDPRQTEQYLQQAGMTRDREGLFALPTGARFQPDYQTLAGSVFERGQAIVAEAWRRAGIDAQLSVLPAAQVRDTQARHTFPGITTLGASSPGIFLAREIGVPENRWAGQNRGGWSNPEYDRLWEAYNSLLHRAERYQQIVQMMKVASDELPAIPLYYILQPTYAHAVALRGPQLGGGGWWNIHEWEIR